MTQDEICGLLRQIHDVVAMQSETNQVKSASDYERGFIDGMQKQAESSVDRAVNAMAQPNQYAPLTDDEIGRIYHRFGGDMLNCARAIERAHGIKENT
jgi:hypothetical protein